MAYGSVHASDGDIWALVERQHGVVSHRQLLGLGLSPAAVKHRIAAGRLFGVHRGVYAVGGPQLGSHGLWTATVLACGSGAVLSHLSPLCLWGLWTASAAPIEVSVPVARRGHRAGLLVHRRRAAALEDFTSREGVPLTAVTRTIIDVAPGSAPPGSSGSSVRPTSSGSATRSRSGPPRHVRPGFPAA